MPSFLSQIRGRGAALILSGQRTRPVIPAPTLEISQDLRTPARITISFRGEPGLQYQLRFSEDLAGWQAVGTPVEGKGSTIDITLPLPAAQQGFFTVAATPLP